MLCIIVTCCAFGWVSTFKRYIEVEHFNPWFQKEYNNSDKNYSLQGYNKNNLLYIQRLDF